GTCVERLATVLASAYHARAGNTRTRRRRAMPRKTKPAANGKVTKKPLAGKKPAPPRRRTKPLGLTPAPELEGVIADFQAAWAMIARGEVDQYRGKYIAVVDGRLVGVGDDWGELGDRVSRELGIPSDRPAVTIVE